MAFGSPSAGRTLKHRRPGADERPQSTYIEAPSSISRPSDEDRLKRSKALAVEQESFWDTHDTTSSVLNQMYHLTHSWLDERPVMKCIAENRGVDLDSACWKPGAQDFEAWLTNLASNTVLPECVKEHMRKKAVADLSRHYLRHRRDPPA